MSNALQNNLKNCCVYILNKCRINYTERHVQNALSNHPDYPSLLAVKDVLSTYGIDSAAIRKSDHEYEDFETPFVCVVQQADWNQPALAVVLDASSSTIVYVDPITGNTSRLPKKDFENIDKGVVMLLDLDNAKDEEDYSSNRKADRVQRLNRAIPLVATVLFVIFSAFYQLHMQVIMYSWVSFSFLFTSTIGLILVSLLLWYEVDAHNAFLKEVCGGEKIAKLNCGAVLKSKGATFLGVNWSVWGGAYFGTFFLCQLLFPGEFGYASCWIYLSIFASLYIPYSLYYQWRVVKQWCPLCLGVIGVLIVNFVLSIVHLLYYNPPFGSIEIMQLLSIGILGSGLLFGVNWVVPLIKQARDSGHYQRRWKQLRYNEDVFDVLLNQQDSMASVPNDMGIVFGNPDAEFEIVKVCNPYCDPCARAHTHLSELTGKHPNIKVRIIFTATGEQNDHRNLPVSHLLALRDTQGFELMHKALDHWYSSGVKDFERFSKLYGTGAEVKDYTNDLKAMSDWCSYMKVRATPTIYIKGKEMPKDYNVDELKMILLK